MKKRWKNLIFGAVGLTILSGLSGLFITGVNYNSNKKTIRQIGLRTNYPELSDKGYTFFSCDSAYIDVKEVDEQRRQVADENNNGYLECAEFVDYFRGENPYSFFSDSKEVERLLPGLTLEMAIKAKYDTPVPRYNIYLPAQRNNDRR